MRLIILVLTLGLISTSCQATPTSVAAEPTKVSHLETSTPTSDLATTTADVLSTQSPSLTEILSTYPSTFWWSSDSSKIYYERNGVWEFDILTGTSKESQTSRPEILPCPYLPNSSNEIIRWQQQCSPSKEKITYYTLQPPLPTSLPSECYVGECPNGYDGFPIDVWVWENGQSRQLGQLISCIKDHRWAVDEQKLIAVGYDSYDRPVPVACDSAYYAWLIDLSQSQITPLLSKADHLNEVFVHDYSPNGNFLLYTELQRLYILNVQTQGITDVQISREVESAWWVDDNKIIILFHLQTGGYNMGWGIFDLESGKFTELLNETNTIGEYAFADPQISPDKKWLAFNAYYPGKDLFGFWSLSLETP